MAIEHISTLRTCSSSAKEDINLMIDTYGLSSGMLYTIKIVDVTKHDGSVKQSCVIQICKSQDTSIHTNFPIDSLSGKENFNLDL